MPGLILIGLVLWLVKSSKRKLDEAADQKRIADSLEQIAKSKKVDKEKPMRTILIALLMTLATQVGAEKMNKKVP